MCSILIWSTIIDYSPQTAPGSPHTDVTPALSPFTPKKEEEADEDEWAEQDGQVLWVTVDIVSGLFDL